MSYGPFEDSEVGMLGLVLDCCICHRLMMFPIHRPGCLQDWHRHGRMCLKCILRTKYFDEGLEGYILEALVFTEYFGFL